MNPRDKQPEDRVVDEFLVMRCQAGDKTALSALIAKWQPPFMRYASVITRDQTLAADVVQDAWIKIIRSLPRLREPLKFPAWSYRIINHQCMDALRAIRRTVPEREVPDASALQQLEVRDQVWNVLEQMSPDHRSALALHYLQGFEVKEIAEIVQAPEGTVKSRLFNAREKFRLILEKQDPESASKPTGEDHEYSGQQDTGSAGISFRST